MASACVVWARSALRPTPAEILYAVQKADAEAQRAFLAEYRAIQPAAGTQSRRDPDLCHL